MSLQYSTKARYMAVLLDFKTLILMQDNETLNKGTKVWMCEGSIRVQHPDDFVRPATSELDEHGLWEIYTPPPVLEWSSCGDYLNGELAQIRYTNTETPYVKMEGDFTFTELEEVLRKGRELHKENFKQ